MDRPPDDTAQGLAALVRENAKLRKINEVLISRVERNIDFQGNAYSLFQTATGLEKQIRERTAELENTLRDLETSNRALSRAKEVAETAQIHLAEAIESISEGFLLCDAEDRIVRVNSKYRELWQGLSPVIHPGMPFKAVLWRSRDLNLLAEDDCDTETAVSRRWQYHLNPEGLLILKLRDGRWIQINERRTADGGSVAIYTDITEIKLSEQKRRKQELAAKNALLQAIFDNISQGISVIDRDGRLVAWNLGFIELLRVPASVLAVGRAFSDFIELPEISCQFSHFGPEAGKNPTDTVCIEKMCGDGRILEIHIGPMPDGGIVSTYTDITERKQTELAFRDSEYRIRLITDALPALIAYVDAEQRYRFTNQPYEEWFGRPRSTINGQLMSTVLGTELYEARRHFAEQALAGRRVTFEIDLATAGGRIRFALATYVPHFGPDGAVLGFFALIQDITERRLAAEEIREAKEGLERRVAERTIELTVVNRKLSQEIDERRLAEEALRLAKAEAEQANMSKTKFIAGASHDLLQPLNAARVFTETVAGSRLGPRNRGLVTNLSLALKSVEELLSTLLDISKLDAGALQPDICDFRLDDLLRPLAVETAPQAKAKGLELGWVASTAVVRSDPLLITRVLRNFLSNAIRYTPGGTILLGCRHRRNAMEIQVLDSGTGIPEEKLGLIFEEFQRLAADPQGNDGGMGLGLAIVERIARLLDHRIVVRSRPGKGSLFGIVVPLGDVRQLRVHAPAVEAAARFDRVRGIRVLVIENDRAERIAMQALLQSWHCKVEVVGSGMAALSRLKTWRQRPDVVVADYHLDAEETGLRVLGAIQAFYQQMIPGIILTADRTRDIQDAVQGAGYQLLNKPLKPSRLRSLLAHFAERRSQG